MSVLCLWLLFFTGFGLSSGEERRVGTNITVYGVLGGSALLQINDSQWVQCNKSCTLEWNMGDRLALKLKKKETNKDCRNISDCTVLPNGSLNLSNLTSVHEAHYTVKIYMNGTLKYQNCFRLQLQAPVSVPEVNHTCYPNASVQLSCLVKNGTELSYTWSVSGTPTPSPAGEILTVYQSVLRNVTCTVRNQVSEEQSQLADITCPDPVSEPVVNYTCLSNGSVQLSCHVENGTDPSYSWSWDGPPETTSNSSGEITVQLTLPIDVTCTARNAISASKSKPTNVSCPDPVSEPVVNYTCLSNGTVQLSCHVENGTDPSYTWNWAGPQETTSNSSGEITVQLTRPIDVTCTARNTISTRKSKPTNVSCPETSTFVTTDVTTSTASPETNSMENNTSRGNTTDADCQHRCLMRSLIGGTVIVIVTTLPLIIGCLYTMPREKRL